MILGQLLPCCGSNAVQAKLKANFLIALLETTAAAGEAAKLHKFIRQIVFQIFRICFNQAVGTFADRLWSQIKDFMQKPKQISHHRV